MRPGPTDLRMVVIGLDAADLSLIEQWSDKGLLPAIARLRREGTWIKLQNRGEYPSTSIWPSIYTGTHPGKCGIYYLIRPAQGRARLELVGPQQCCQPPFWKHLQTTGLYSIIVDVPFTRPIPGFCGLQLCNWGSYERYGPSVSEPPLALDDIQQRFGRYPLGGEFSRNAPITPGDFRRAHHQLLAGVRAKGELLRGLMSEYAWDFFMGVFGETHPAGHYFWESHDFSSGVKTSAGLDSALLAVYQSVDEEIDRILACLDQRTVLLLVSGHGMGPNHVGWHLLPAILKQMGFAHSKGGEIHGQASVSTLLKRLRGSIPRRWRDLFSRLLPNKIRDGLQIYWAGSSIDWLRDAAFSLPTDAHGFVRVNLKGREVSGNVAPGAEYEETCRKIRGTFKNLFHPRTGMPVVEDVFLTDEVFPGPARPSLPDLIVTWRDGAEIDAAAGHQIPAVSGKLPDPRSGNHRREGFALLYGPGVAKGRQWEGHLLDIAPTILRFYGADLPGFLDGRPWHRLFSP